MLFLSHCLLSVCLTYKWTTLFVAEVTWFTVRCRIPRRSENSPVNCFAHHHEHEWFPTHRVRCVDYSTHSFCSHKFTWYRVKGVFISVFLRRYLTIVSQYHGFLCFLHISTDIDSLWSHPHFDVVMVCYTIGALRLGRTPIVVTTDTSLAFMSDMVIRLVLVIHFLSTHYRSHICKCGQPAYNP